MASNDEEARRILEETWGTLDEEARAFLRSRTGIEEEARLKEHILEVQAGAFAVRRSPSLVDWQTARTADEFRAQVHKYRCVQNFSFLK